MKQHKNVVDGFSKDEKRRVDPPNRLLGIVLTKYFFQVWAGTQNAPIGGRPGTPVCMPGSHGRSSSRAQLPKGMRAFGSAPELCTLEIYISEDEIEDVDDDAMDVEQGFTPIAVEDEPASKRRKIAKGKNPLVTQRNSGEDMDSEELLTVPMKAVGGRKRGRKRSATA